MKRYRLDLGSSQSYASAFLSQENELSQSFVTPPVVLRSTATTKLTGPRKKYKPGREGTNDKSFVNPFLKKTETPTKYKPPMGPSRLLSSFDVLTKVGSGDYGCVWKCRRRLDGCMYAVKELSKANRPANLNEVWALSAVSSSNHSGSIGIVRYYDAWQEDEKLYIQTEFCEHGDLSSKQLSAECVFNLIHDIALALACIHNIGFAHLDIKPSNILKSDSTLAAYKLTDFGLACALDATPVDVGDSMFLCKHLLNDQYDQLDKADIYALGKTALYLATFPSSDPDIHDCPEDFGIRSLITSMTDPNPQHRPTAVELCDLLQI